MAKDWKERLGVVYSTNPEFGYSKQEEEIQETLPKAQQNLKVRIDRKQRKGKVATLIEGFIGTPGDLDVLAKKLKTKCGVGGTSKDGVILIQGDFCQKIIEILVNEGYKAKKAGG
ncbi:MAG: translation initiation factor [Bacteroidales bacterium]|nr:translation initiation factor [Bacteroidales bacterium]